MARLVESSPPIHDDRDRAHRPSASGAAHRRDDGRQIPRTRASRSARHRGCWLYAIGEVCGRALITHMGKCQGRVVGNVIAVRATGRSTDGSPYHDVADHGIVPAVVFTSLRRPRSASRVSRRASRDRTWRRSSRTSGRSRVQACCTTATAGRAKLVVGRVGDTLPGRRPSSGSMSPSCRARPQKQSSAR